VKRRQFIKGGVLATLGLLLFKPVSLLASWPKKLFSHQQYQSALNELLQGEPLITGDQVNLKIPPISQNGVEVPLSVKTTLQQVERIVIMVENNPNPMVAEYLFSGSTTAYIATRIKMNGTSLVHAIIKADGKYYGTAEKVTIKRGGCYETGG